MANVHRREVLLGFVAGAVGVPLSGTPSAAAVRTEPPARVADEHVYAGSEATVEEGCNPIGEITLIKEVADRDEIHRRRRTGGEIIADRRDLDTVQFGVEAERGEGVAIDLSRDHLACSGFRRSDADIESRSISRPSRFL